ncbi:MAG TPA: site-2 protease family protein [Bryobacteraceae bacterium]|jgi:Zn-dependent protease/CBS domain-containing protein|nr:site-2 protease family protein [Bryobacteraceae bacterium]
MPDDAPPTEEKPKAAPSSGTLGVLRIFGVPVRFHFTFILLLIFLLFIGVGERQSGAMTALYVVALFASVLLHELGHTLVARRYGIRTTEIVMYPIGGISRPERIPKGREEFWIAIAGPSVNGVIAAGLFVWLATQHQFIPFELLRDPTDANLAQRIATGNFLLFIFNLLPAYPMDGGRILRSVLMLFKPEEEATRIAASSGQALAAMLGLYGLLSSNFIVVFIAMFIYIGASQEGAAVRGRLLTTGVPVRSAMITDFRTLAHGESIRDAGNLLLATSQHDFPVMHGDQVLGLLTRAALVRAMLTEGPDAYVASAMDRNPRRVSPDMPLSEVLQDLSGARGCALVMDGEKLLGLLTSENVSSYILLRQVAMQQQARAHSR